MIKLSALRSDTDLSENGRWVDYEEGVRLRVAKANSANYQKVVMRLIRDNPSAQEDDDAFQNVVKMAAAQALLMDWDGVADEEGNPLPYTIEIGEKTLLDPSYQDLYQAVVSASQDGSAYRVKTAGN